MIILHAHSHFKCDTLQCTTYLLTTVYNKYLVFVTGKLFPAWFSLWKIMKYLQHREENIIRHSFTEQMFSLTLNSPPSFIHFRRCSQYLGISASSEGTLERTLPEIVLLHMFNLIPWTIRHAVLFYTLWWILLVVNLTTSGIS